jgi:hypothetical protein
MPTPVIRSSRSEDMCKGSSRQETSLPNCVTFATICGVCCRIRTLTNGRWCVKMIETNLGPSMPNDDQRPSLGQRVIHWIETTCRVPEGALVGSQILLLPWQREAILKIYDNPAGTRRCIISVGRKSGKTTLAACLLLMHLAGPAALPNSQLYSAAKSRPSRTAVRTQRQGYQNVASVEQCCRLP